MAQELKAGQRIHLVGIGGAGLSAIARILLERGYEVTGSDMIASPVTTALAAEGARVFIGHDAANIGGAEIVLATSAASWDHVEVVAAQAAGLPVFRRRDFMAALLRGCDTIAVAGTHGKTTTTSMIAHILRSAGLAPGYIVGAAMGNTGRNASDGESELFVIEADEYDNMFLGLAPRLAVVTNVELDHPDFFPSAAALTASFQTFVSRLERGGTLVACADDPVAAQIAEARRASGGRVVSYGIAAPDMEWRAADLRVAGRSNEFSVVNAGRRLGDVALRVPGAHNVLNALAAIAVASDYGVRFETCVAALRSFKATARRFEIRGERDGVTLVDDYAHHPTEIRVNLQAARERFPQHQIWAVWQPHTYTRAKKFWSDFVKVFADADKVVVLPIYAARERPLAGVSSAGLVRDISSTRAAMYSPSFVDAAAVLRHSVSSPAVVLIFSAGDANIIADLYLNADA